MILKYNKAKLKVGMKLIIANVAFATTNATAEIVLEHSATVTAGTEYHSNLQFLNRNEESVYLYKITPEYKLTALDEKNSWIGRLGLAVQRSSNSKISRDREDPFASVGWKRTLESGSVGLSASYREESSRTAQIVETGLVTEDGTSNTRQFVADWSHNISSRLNLITQAVYEKVNFNNAEQLSNFETRTVMAELDYKFNEKITPYTRLTAGDFRSNDSTNHDRAKFQEFIAGALFTLNESLNVRAGAGVTHVSTTGEDDFAGLISANYIKERSILGLELSHSVNPAASGRLETADAINANYKYALSERSSLGVGMGLNQNDSGYESQQISGFYTRDLNPSLLMNLFVGYINTKSEGQSSVYDGSVGITFTYNSPNF